MSLGLAAQHGEAISQLVLLSPLLYFFTLDLCQQAFALTARDNSQLKLGKTDERATEFHKLGNSARASDFAKLIVPHTKVSIFQAATDDTTPGSYAEALVNQFKTRPHYETVPTDHSFLINREQALNQVLRAL